MLTNLLIEFIVILLILERITFMKQFEFKIGKITEYFTQREFEVFQNIFVGLSSKQIAKKLSLSPRTVEDYVDNIKRKLQCRYKRNIIEAAIRYGIVEKNFINEIIF